MAISKAVRQAVYEKFGGRCAYCGREIKYQDMQVDHFVAKNGYSECGSDDISNLMPSCRMCNHYKRANTLETFRRYIQEIPSKLRENYIYKVGVAYGNNQRSTVTAAVEKLIEEGRLKTAGTTIQKIYSGK